MTSSPNTDVAGSDDLSEYFELALEMQWSDGLPIIPPTNARVEAMIGKFDPDRVLGVLPPRNGIATVRAVAANAVMAGCAPGYFPVVVAAVEAVADPKFWLYGLTPTTSAGAIALLVNGPIPREIGVNSGVLALGPGWRANMTIGRAVRLVTRNVGGGVPTVGDLSTQGHPGMLSLCWAEAVDSPWPELAADRGLMSEGQSAVTAFSALSLISVFDTVSHEPYELLRAFVNALQRISTTNVLIGNGPTVVFCPEHANVLASAGFTRQDVERFLYEHARVPIEWFPKANVENYLTKRREKWVYCPGPEARIPIGRGPQDFHVTVAGGEGPHSTVMSSLSESYPVTRIIET